MAKLRLVGAVGIKVRPDTSEFRKDVEKALDRIPDDAKVKLNITADLEPLKRKLDKAERDESKRVLNLKIGVDTDALLAAKRRVHQALADLKTTTIPVKMDEPGLKKAVEKIDNLLAKSSLKLAFDPADLGELKRERARIEEALKSHRTQTTLEVKNNEESLKQAAKELDELTKQRQAEIKAQAHTLDASAQLAYAQRARIVPFYVRINERSLAIAEGVLLSLSGINVLKDSGRAFETLITKFDTISLKTAGLATLVGSITDGLVFMASALLPVAEGIAEAVGLLAFAPAAMASITAVALINIAAFDNFKKAIDGNAEALAGLPPEARRTALALQGTWKAIQEPVQNSFWRGMGDAMETSFKAFIPLVSKGLADSAEHVGRFGAGMFRAFEKISLAGGPLETMLSNLSGFFDNAAGAAEPLFNAINILGLRGSEFLPRFGTYITDMTNRFNNWITAADEAGKITVWMEQGVQSLKDMWTLSGGVIKMFQGITMAAEAAGAADLTEVAAEFSRIGDMMKSEPFQSRMGTIFEGARAGASALNVGVKDLGLTVGKSSLFFAALLSQLGELGGQALSGVATAIRNVDFQNGILKGLQGMSVLLDTLNPSFDDMGSIIGKLSTIAGGAFSSIGPVISNIIDLVNVMVGTLEDNLLNIIPNLMGMVGGLVSALSGPILALTDGLNAVLGFINSLPAPLANLTTAMLAFVLLAGKIGPMFAAKPGGFLEKITYDFQQADTARSKFSGGLKNIGSGLLSAVGGPWGLAIGALVTGLALAGQRSMEAKSRIEEYTNSIDKNTGALTANGYASAAKNLLDDAGFWEDRIRGAKKTQESIELLGLSFQKTAETAAKGGPDYDSLMSKLDEFPGITGEGGKSLSAFADALGISDDAASKLSQGDIVHLKQRLSEINTEARTGRDDFSNLNDAVTKFPADVAAQKASDFRAAMEQFNDRTATADTRVRALNKALDILSGRQPDLESAQRDVNDAMRDANGQLADVNGEMKLTGGIWRDGTGAVKDFSGVIDPLTGKIDSLKTQVGSDLHKHLDTMTNDVKGVALQMRDAKAPVGEITKYLADQREAFIKQGEGAGLSRDMVAAAWDYMIGAKPDVLLTTIMTEGQEEAKKRIDEIKGKVEEVNAFKAVAKIEGDNFVLGEKLAQSYDKLSEFDQFVATATVGLDPTAADSTRQRIVNDLINLAASDPTVLAYIDPAILDAERIAILARLDELAKQRPTPEVKAETEDAKAQLGIVQGLLAEVNNNRPKPKVEPETADANGKLDTTKGKLDWLAQIQANPKVDANTVPALLKLTDVGNKLDPFNNKTYQFSVIAKFTQSGQPVDLSTMDRQMADGAILNGAGNGMYGFDPRMVKFFAGGGIENHTAQIARPSSVLRVWAEPETGGEAYIPLATSKRARSTAILNEVAQQFGYNLTPQSFESGGVVGGTGGGSGTHIHIDAQPGLSYQYAQEVAAAAEVRFRDAQVLYNISE